MKPLLKNGIIFLCAVFLIAGFFSLYSRSSVQKEEKIGIATFLEEVADEKIERVELQENTILITLKDGKKQTATKEPNDSLGTLMKNFNADPEKMKKFKIDIKENSSGFLLNAFFTIILPFLILGFFIFLMIRQIQGANARAMNFGMSRARQFDGKKEENRITFKDVAGAREAKEELQEVIEFLRDPKKFTNVGAKIPKGVMLVGAPGTGKTLFAKAVAGEADVPFFHVSGSEFIEMFVGVGASRVRDLFTRAMKNAPCIVFIDEIDAVGRQRGAGLGGSHDEREQTLNQILVELDGFDPSTNVIVLAATNRPDVLDPALLRPGRFDRRVVIDLPSIEDRTAILEVHARNKPLASDADLRKVAERTPGFSGADLANVLNEAAILVARRNASQITLDDIFKSIEKVILGPERKSHVMSEKEKKITAYHEAGHALVSHLLPDAPPVQKISIIARGQAAGYTLNLPTEDRQFRTKKEFLSELAVLLGGFVAEKTVFEDVTTGASNDLKKATRLAKNIVTVYGMSEHLGQRTFGDREEMIFLGREITEQRDYSEKTAEHIDEEITNFFNGAYAQAERLITTYREKIETIVQLLLEKETIEREAFLAIFAE
ncbi:ATP-dependent metallopeptidase FtsH/Yme1/Tma family protein [Candidatus Uhrbacteria bacterium]|nr:ATP-dependent metallopeptidase FtsH/Yme1/Tma family protein [Candidatus Uhrbacteria bacterium]